MSELFPQVIGGHHDGLDARRWAPNPHPGQVVDMPAVVEGQQPRNPRTGTIDAVDFTYHRYVIERFRLGHREFLVLCADAHRAHQRDARDRAVVDRLLTIAGITAR